MGLGAQQLGSKLDTEGHYFLGFLSLQDSNLECWYHLMSDCHLVFILVSGREDKFAENTLY